MSNQTTYKPGNNQSGIGQPVHGPYAHAASAAYIASVCPMDDQFSRELRHSINMTKWWAERVLFLIQEERGEQ
jgi:hypothetical protein